MQKSFDTVNFLRTPYSDIFQLEAFAIFSAYPMIKTRNVNIAKVDILPPNTNRCSGLIIANNACVFSCDGDVVACDCDAIW